MMRVEKRDIFVSVDEKVFDTESECVAHEQNLAAQARRIERLKVYTVRSSFDATEGRGYHQTSYVVTDQSMAVIIEYCLDRFGRPLASWYGDGFYESWILYPTEFTAQDAIRLSKEPHGGIALTKGGVDLVFLSRESVDHPDLPKCVFPWPKPPKKEKA